MGQHVFAWVAGHGWTLMPFAPFRFERVASRPKSILIERELPSGVQRVVVAIMDDGTAMLTDPDGGVTDRFDVVELIEGAAFPFWDHGAKHDHWRIETSLLSVSWPMGFAMSSVADVPPVFELKGPDGAMIWIQGPFGDSTVPTLEQLVAAGQTTERTWDSSGGPMIELRYFHDGELWQMNHCIVSRFPGAFCVVSGQALTRGGELVRAAVEEVAASLTPCQGE